MTNIMQFGYDSTFIKILYALKVIEKLSVKITKFNKTINVYKWNYLNPLTYILITIIVFLYCCCAFIEYMVQFINHVSSINVTDITEEYY